MATLTYYTFSKRHKSTKQSTSGSQIDVQLKDGVSLTNPVFLLNWSGFPTFNYCEFGGRYYFVTDVRQIRNDLFEVECEEDYLASWKSVIGSTEAMILYATGGSDSIIDNRIPTTSPVYVSHQDGSIDNITITDGNQGTVILSITGTGSFGNYVMQNSTQVFELMSDIDLWNSGNITDVVTGFQQFCTNGNASDNLKSAIALPILASAMTSGTLEPLYLGNYPCTDAGGNPIMGYRITDPLAKGYFDVSIPWRFSDWRRHSPYTNLYMYIPLIGTVSLPTDDLVGDTHIAGTYCVNITSGDVSAEIVGGNSGKFIGTVSSNCAMATPFGSSNISGAKVASAVVTGAAGIIGAAFAPTTGGASLALFSGLAASAGQMINAAHGETKGGGGLGGGASHGLFKDIRLTSVSKELTDSQTDLNPIMGKPVMQKATISSYGGFIQTDGAQVAGNMNNNEREVINSLLDGGIYYE